MTKNHFLLLCFVALSMACATTGLKVDPCTECPFTERPVPVWSPPDFPSLPPTPEWKSPSWTEEMIRANPQGYVAALMQDFQSAFAAYLEARDAYDDIKNAATIDPGT